MINHIANTWTRRAVTIVVSTVVAVAVVSSVFALTVISHSDPAYWDGYTYEHFDYLLGYGSGEYYGQTSVWANNAMSQLGSRSRGFETCNYGSQTDWDTTTHWTYNSVQSWVQGNGGYANDWWDCPLNQSIEGWYDASWYNISPYVAQHGLWHAIFVQDP